MGEGPSSPDRTGRRLYGLRWVGHALRSTAAFFGVKEFLVGAVGTTLGLFVLVAVIDPESIDEAWVEARWLLFGAGGILLLLVGVFLVQLVLAPAGMERLMRAMSERERAEAATATSDAIKDLTTERDAARAEVARLHAEISASEIRIELDHDGGALTAIDTSDETRAHFLEAEGPRYRAGLEEWQEEEADRRAGPWPTLHSPLERDTRKPQAFLDELTAYGERLKVGWTPFLRHAVIDQQVTALRIVARNPTGRAFASVQVEIRLPPDVGAGFTTDAEWTSDVAVPPVAWGDDTVFASLRNVVITENHDPGSIERVGESLVVRFDPFDLRPHARAPLDKLWLFIPVGYAGGELHIPWEAASAERAVLGRASGDLVVPVAADAADPVPVLVAAHGLGPR